jgi:hypothetical protein
VNHQYKYHPMTDAGLYLIKSGQPIDEPAQMLLIKNDPNFNEQWPRALVPYERIYGMKEPRHIPALPNDGGLSKHLPEGTPFGLVGSSSLYKRESYPNGTVPEGAVAASFISKRDGTGYAGLDPFNTSENGASLNWINQGAEAGRYSSEEIHAVRILAMEPTTDRDRGHKPGRLFRSHAMERLRILGEIPVRKFKGGQQPSDPDGNPDTSFLARIPADTAFSFQTLDKDGMVLNMAQTWHQLRPGEVRNDCGGCHAHSQKPTEFSLTAASKPDYAPFDLTERTPLLTTKSRDESGQKWDEKNQTGLRFEKGVKSVEYFRDIKPIIARSCLPCHQGMPASSTTEASRSEAVGENPIPASSQADGNLVLDDDAIIKGVPGTYYRLAMDHGDGGARFGYKPVIHNGTWRQFNASRYIRMFQSRRSLLIWKIYGRRTDGWSNDDFPTETIPGDAKSLQWKGEPIPNTQRNRDRADLDYTGSIMPPLEAVAGTYTSANGTKVKVPPLSDEDRLTFVRWIDLGCPIDLDYDANKPGERGQGWMVDDNRPTLTVTYPRPGKNPPLTRLLIGMHDYYTGLDMESLEVVADFSVGDLGAGQNLSKKFKVKSPGVWELSLTKPITDLASAKLIVSMKDRQGNVARIERTFSVGGVP